MERLTREVKISDGGTRITIGTANYKDLRSIYLEFSGFVRPYVYEENYSGLIKDVKKDYNLYLKQFIKETILFSEDTIKLFEVSDDRMEYEKDSYFFIQTVLKINEPIRLKFKELVDRVKNNVITLSNDIRNSFTDKGMAVVKKKGSETVFIV